MANQSPFDQDGRTGAEVVTLAGYGARHAQIPGDGSLPERPFWQAEMDELQEVLALSRLTDTPRDDLDFAFDSPVDFGFRDPGFQQDLSAAFPDGAFGLDPDLLDEIRACELAGEMNRFTTDSGIPDFPGARLSPAMTQASTAAAGDVVNLADFRASRDR